MTKEARSLKLIKCAQGESGSHLELVTKVNMTTIASSKKFSCVIDRKVVHKRQGGGFSDAWVFDCVASGCSSQSDR